jgi:hypothetical protein
MTGIKAPVVTEYRKKERLIMNVMGRKAVMWDEPIQDIIHIYMEMS